MAQKNLAEQLSREARIGLTRYLDFYNQEHPHQALDYRTPAEVYRCAVG